MAGDIYKKVHPGDPPEIPSALHNQMIDLVLERRARTVAPSSGRPAPDLVDADVVLVKNNSGADRARFDVLGIDGPIFTPTDNLHTFKNATLLKGITPAAGTHDALFVILAEPIPDGKIGRAWISGACQVQISVSNAAHKYADIADGQCGYLASGTTGAAQILWKESGTGQKWAVIRFFRAPSEAPEWLAFAASKGIQDDDAIVAFCAHEVDDAGSTLREAEFFLAFELDGNGDTVAQTFAPKLSLLLGQNSSLEYGDGEQHKQGTFTVELITEQFNPGSLDAWADRPTSRYGSYGLQTLYGRPKEGVIADRTIQSGFLGLRNLTPPANVHGIVLRAAVTYNDDDHTSVYLIPGTASISAPQYMVHG